MNKIQESIGKAIQVRIEIGDIWQKAIDNSVTNDIASKTLDMSRFFEQAISLLQKQLQESEAYASNLAKDNIKLRTQLQETKQETIDKAVAVVETTSLQKRVKQLESGDEKAIREELIKELQKIKIT